MTDKPKTPFDLDEILGTAPAGAKPAPAPKPTAARRDSQPRPVAAPPVPPPPARAAPADTEKQPAAPVDDDWRARVSELGRELFTPVPGFPAAACREAVDELRTYGRALPVGYKVGAGIGAAAIVVLAGFALSGGPEVRYVAGKQPLWSGPGNSHGEAMTLEANTAVRVLDTVGEHALVLDPNDRAGWVAAAQLADEPSEPPAEATIVAEPTPPPVEKPAPRPKKPARKPKKKPQ